jgi:hypothetical protein
MTISTLINRKEYTGNGVNDTFAYTFWISADGDLKVYVDSVLQTITTDYTVTLAGEPTGGNVVFEAGSIPADQSSVVIWRDVPKTQSTDYVGGEKFSAETHETALDRLTVIAQQLQDDMDRCIKLAKTVTDTGLIELDQGASTRAGKFLSFDSSGDLAGSTTFGTNKGEWATSTVYVIGDTVYDGTNGASTYNVYTCSEDHTSGVWATDLAAPKWTLSINVATITTAAQAAQTAAESAQAYAEEWANKAEDSLISAAAGGDEVDDYSALHFAAKAAADAILTAADAVSTAADLVLTNADVVSTNADVVLTGLDVDATNADVVSTNADVVSTNADVVLASQWATLLDALVAATDYSAKEWAIGTTVPSGSAKDWAVVLAAMVDGADYSAKEYAIGTTVAAGSAKEWAITVEDTLVDGVSYSALHHAAKAAASAAAAAATLADAVTVTGANEISGVAEKAAPVYADIVLIEDSEASYVKKKVQMSNMLGGDIHQGNDPPATTREQSGTGGWRGDSRGCRR